MGERLPCTQEADGSSPFTSTIDYRLSVSTVANIPASKYTC